MKIIVVTIAFIGLGCATTAVRQWSGNQIEVCGNVIAGQEDFVERATRHGCANPVAQSGSGKCQVFSCDNQLGGLVVDTWPGEKNIFSHMGEGLTESSKRQQNKMHCNSDYAGGYNCVSH